MAATHEDILVTGLSARFPQADSLTEFKEKLYAGFDFVTDDESRWPRGHLGLPERTGKIRDLSLFDAECFGVFPKQAHLMDPQMRLLLETCYEAIVDSGYDPQELRGRRVGVFIGCSNSESHEAFSFNVDKMDGYGLTGSLLSMFANRVAHSFDFQGFSMAIDTGCSSTMSAMHQAVHAIRSGLCEAAIVGGSSIYIKAAASLAFLRLGMLSPDGKCQSFDARANGYARSEAVGVFFLQRASEARRVYAKVVHIKAYSDGYRSEGITFPSHQALARLLSDTYSEAGVDPFKVGFVEAHGTGTQVGDTQELLSISNVFCRAERDKPLLVGAVKSNLGHAEPASGITSLAKVILALETGTIAGNLHFREPNPNIACLHDGSIQVVDKATPLPGDLVGLNSFGLGGTSVHVILEANRGPHVDSVLRDKPELPRLVIMAGRSEDSLRRTLDRMEEEGPYPDSAYALLNRTGQPSPKQFPYRGFALIPVDGSGKEVLKVVERVPLEQRPVWFAFTGMGSQWKGMARQMMQFDPFTRSIRKSHDVLTRLGVDLIDAVTNANSTYNCMALVQASIAAVQVALVDTLRAIGIQPDGMIGHSVGELGCAYADGCLTSEQTVLCGYWRGHSMDIANLPNGAMAAVGLTWEKVAERCTRGVVPACHNAEDSVTVSGPADAVAKFVEEMKSAGVFVREVDSANVAFHSQHMELVAPAFHDSLQKVLPEHKQRSKRWVSSCFPESRWHEPTAKNCSPEYLVQNLAAPVLFHEALLHAPENAIFVEIGPHCLLQAILRRAVGSNASCLGLMKRGEDNVTFFLKSLGKLHTLGVQLDLSHLYPAVPFPVPRGTPSIGHLVSWDHSQQWTVAKWNEFAGSREVSHEVVEISLGSNEEDAYLAGHQIDGRVIFPGAGSMVLAWKYLTKGSGKPFKEVPVVFEDVTFHKPIILPKTGTVRVFVHVMPVTGEFEISESGSLVASGRIHVAKEGERLTQHHPPRTSSEAGVYELSAEDVYKDLRLRGYGYTGSFQGILKADMNRPCGTLLWSENWVTFIDSMFQFCVFLDPLRAFRLPARIHSCMVDPRLHAEIVQANGDGGAQVLYDSCLNICSAGGVAFRGLKGKAVASRRSQAVALDEYRFLPYFDHKELIQERHACLQEYVSVCGAVLRNILEANRENMTGAHGLLDGTSNVSQESLNRYLSSTAEKTGLLGALTAIQVSGDDPELTLPSKVRWVMTNHKKDLDEDILNTALLKEDPLRSLLDVVVENTSFKKIRVLELAFAESFFLLTPWISKWLTLSNIVLKPEYAVAHPCPDDGTLQELPEDVKKYSWDLASNLVNGLPDSQLIVARVLPSSSVRLEALAEQLSLLCKEHTFVLLLLRTALAPVEKALTQVAHVSTAVDTMETAVTVFKDYGFQLVGMRSNIWSTLILLRKMSSPAVISQQETIQVDNRTFAWVDTGKDKIIDAKTTTAGHNLWFIGKDTGTSGVIGLMNCLLEEAGSSRVRCVFDASLQESEMLGGVTLTDPECKELLEWDLTMNVRRDGRWGSFRRLTMFSNGPPKRTTEYAYLSIQTRGDLSSLQWNESPLGCASPSSRTGKLLCSVYYAPLNFRDVMLATGKLPADALPDELAASECLLGLEFSGRDTHGRRVMGLVRSQAMATAIAADPEWIWEVPVKWTLEEASTVPVAYTTAYYALLVRGNMRPGESLLVHSGSGGVGQAAISIALSMGCTIFTTVGSEGKREFLKRRFPQLVDRNIACSRDLSFEEVVLRETDGRGVDIVLNSLSEEKLQASVRCLALHGRFLEIGKFDLSGDSPLGMSVFLKNISFHGILLERLQGSDSVPEEDKRHVRELLREGIASGAVRPLDVNRFHWSQAEEAFRFMASGKHIGKVVLEVRKEEASRKVCPPSRLTVEAVARTYFHEHKSYIIVGGLGGVGLELSNWMVGRGCRKLLLNSRSGVKTGYQKLCLRRWQKAGAEVVVTKADVSTEEGARQIIEEALAMGPVGAIFNLAAVISDALLENQTSESFERVCKPKVNGTMRLDELSRGLCPELDHFVVFSSVVSGSGNAGQTNYGYANSVMDRICEQRAADGLPGLAIQWGAIGDAGMLQETTGCDVVIAGCTSQRLSSCLNVLDQFLNQSHPVVMSFVKADRTSACGETETNGRSLVQTIAQIFGVKEASHLNVNMSLKELGMDSLMGFEVQQTLERDYDIAMPISEIQQLTFTRLLEMSGVTGTSVKPADTTAA